MSQSESPDSDSRPSAPRRPVLIHLNADTTWLLSIPYPTQQPGARAPPGRTRFNILIDPWLQGPQIDGAGWFSKQWHAIESSVQHISEVETLLQEAEKAEQDRPLDQGPSITSYIDAVVVSHEFTDHCHENTLREVHADVPVYATTKAAELIQSWSHFTTVSKLPPFTPGSDWRSTSVSPLPSWLGISRLVTKDDALYYHSAVVICMSAVASTSTNEAEAIIYTPHGVEATSFTALTSAAPPLHTLAFLHGLHDVSLRFTKQLNLGAHNALKAQRMLRAKYWVGTHDEVKKGGGLIAAFLRRKPYTLKDALTHEAAKLAADGEGEASPSDAAFVDLGNGERLTLT